MNDQNMGIQDNKERSYTIHYSGKQLKIKGTDYEDAIAVNLWDIGKMMQLGNIAGFNIEAASIKYDPTILNGHGGGVFEITSCGSDSKIGYDAIADQPVTKTAMIAGISKDELPEIHIFTFNKPKPPYNPLTADISTLSYGGRYGTAWAIMSYVAAMRSTQKDGYIEGKIVVKSPRMETYQPMRFTEKMRELMIRCQPKTDAYTRQLIARADELVSGLDPSHNLSNEFDSSMKESLTRTFLYRYGKITAVKYYRERMGATAQQIADKTGISLRQYWRYENGEGSLGDASGNVVLALAEALGVTPSHLISMKSTRYVSERKENARAGRIDT